MKPFFTHCALLLALAVPVITRGNNTPPVISTPNYALDFNGFNTSASTAAPLPAMSAVTIEGWFNAVDGNNIQFLTSMGAGNYEIQLGQGINGLRFIPIPGVYLDTQPNAYTPGQWVHVACVYDPVAAVGKVYLNGIDQGAINNGPYPLTTPLNSPASPLQLGLRSDGSYPYNGLLVQVRVWNTARTAAQIQQDYQSPVVTQTNLIAGYPFSEGNGTTTADVSGNGQTITLNGSTWSLNAPPVTSSEVPPTWLANATPTTGFTVNVSDADGDALTAIWSVNGTALQTNYIAAGGPPTTATLAFTNTYNLASNSVLLAVADGLSATTTLNAVVYVLPAVPTGLTAATTGSQVNLRWAAAALATSYNVKRAPTANGTYTTIATVTATNYTDTAVAGTVNYYLVTAVNVAGESASSKSIPGDYLRPVINPADYALNFDGSAGSYASTTTPLPAMSAVTIEGWFNWADYNNDIQFLTSMGVGNYEIQLGQGDHGLRFIPTAGVYLDTPNNVIPPGQWIHVACVYDPNAQVGEIYLNGVAQGAINDGSLPLTTALNTPASPLQLGLRSGGSYPYNGLIGEVRVWNVARTAAQIQADYQSHVSAQSNLIACYPFSEGTGTTTADISGNANDVTLNGNVTWTTNNPFLSPSPLTNYLNARPQAFNLTANVMDTDGNALTAVWSVNGIPLQTNFVAASGPPTFATLIFTNTYGSTSNDVLLAVADDYSSTTTHFTIYILATVPTDLTVTETGLQADLNWSVAVDATSYNVYRATSPNGTYTVLANVTATNYTDTTITPNTTYFYVITAVNSAGESAACSSAHVGNSPPIITPLSYALNFDGHNSAYASTAHPLPAMSAVTIEAWVNWSNTHYQAESLTIMQDNMGDENYEIRLSDDHNDVSFSPNPNVYIETANDAIIPGQWTHIACVYDPATQTGQIYLNGVAQAVSISGNLSTPLNPPTSPLMFGTGQTGPYFGLLGEVRVWNVARTAAEIQADYQSPVSAQPNLIACYPFSEGAGTTTADISGNNNPLTLIGDSSDPVTWTTNSPFPVGSLTHYFAATAPLTSLSANIMDTDGNALTAVWSVNGTPIQTNFVAAGGPPTTATVTFTY